MVYFYNYDVNSKGRGEVAHLQGRGGEMQGTGGKMGRGEYRVVLYRGCQFKFYYYMICPDGGVSIQYLYENPLVFAPIWLTFLTIFKVRLLF